jgi:hypothetical protein
MFVYFMKYLCLVTGVALALLREITYVTINATSFYSVGIYAVAYAMPPTLVLHVKHLAKTDVRIRLAERLATNR